MVDHQYAANVNQHYSTVDTEAAVMALLTSMGKENSVLTSEDIAPIDQFHIGGREATLALAAQAGITAATRVLDVGGGLGGPARTLAAAFGCAVTVLDLTETYCRVGAMLTTRSGLTDLVNFELGNALDMPFTDGSFDLVWTQHSSMNIEDKPKLYAEIARVTRSKGRLALHEIMAGPVQPVQFPLPWARDASISFLWTPERIRELLAGLGYREIVWDDLTDQSASAPRPPAAITTPGLEIVAGEDFPQRAASLRKNFAENRLALIRAVLDLT